MECDVENEEKQRVKKSEDIEINPQNHLNILSTFLKKSYLKPRYNRK